MIRILTSDYAYQVLNLIRSSKSSIDILCYIFNANLYKKSDKSNLIFLELKKFFAHHNNVRFLLDSPKIHKPNYHPIKFFTRRFKEAGFDIRYLDSGDTQHAKVFIFDNKIAIAGSHNLTTKSVISRHDISFLFDDHTLLSYLCNYFSSIWSEGIEA